MDIAGYDTALSNPVTLPALLGDYPVTRAIRRGDVTSPFVRLEFADVKSAASAFKRLVRDMEIDAAILGGEMPADPRVVPLIPDPAGAARAWREKHGAIQVNHMVTVKESLSRSQPHVVEEVYRMLAASKRAAGPPAAGDLDTTP